MLSPDTAIRILDVGGWFAPCVTATHVVDIMPYETRRGRLSLEPEPGERFTRDTWHQADFLAPSLRLPYPDGWFDLVYCGQTLEDLADPVPLLREIARIARAGRVVSPSRISEQTRGVRDRATSLPGHPHHHWIIDTSPDGLEFHPKPASVAAPSSLVPLRVFERLVAAGLASPNLDYSWDGPLRWRIHDDTAASRRAADFARSLEIPARERVLDALWRAARRIRDRAFSRPRPLGADWWRRMLELSKPYDRLK